MLLCACSFSDGATGAAHLPALTFYGTLCIFDCAEHSLCCPLLKLTKHGDA
jgi:hypothetical protein